MVGDNNLDSPGTTTAAGATEQSHEGTSDEKKKLLEEEKTDGTKNAEGSTTGAFEVIDVDEEIHLLD